MILIDTSAFYALLDRSDANHEPAGRIWINQLQSGRTLFTSNYVVVECCALLQNRLGMEAVRTFHDGILPVVTVHWIDESLHVLAATAWRAAGRRRLSLVDCSSFALLRRERGRQAFAFDRHFEEEGFTRPEL